MALLAINHLKNLNTTSDPSRRPSFNPHLHFPTSTYYYYSQSKEFWISNLSNLRCKLRGKQSVSIISIKMKVEAGFVPETH